MKDRSEVIGVVLKAVSSYIGSNPPKLTGCSHLETDFGIDSTEMVCIVIDLEKELDICLKKIDFSELKTPSDIAGGVLDAIAANEAVGALA